MNRWTEEGGATSDRSRTPAREPLFALDVLPQVDSKKKKNTTRKNK
jgi:hypothetical protein